MQRSFTFVLLLVVCFVLSVGPVVAQDAPTPEPVGLRPDAPTYAVHGPYWVGVTETTIDENTDHPIPLIMWYPAQNPEGLREDTRYMWPMKWDPMPPEPAYPVRGHALRDAEPDSSGAPYPLVVFSHDYSGSGSISAPLLEHLASYGFVVMAPEHSEHYYPTDANPYRDLAEFEFYRPRDLVRVMDFASDLSGSSGRFAGLVDMDQVAAVGYSGGAGIALEVAGAQGDATTNSMCPQILGMTRAQCDAFFQEVANLEQLETVPQTGLWPSVAYPRVKAVVPIAGDVWSYDEAGLAEVTVPILAMAGSADPVVPMAIGVPVAYENVSSPQKALALFEGAGHGLFNAPCTDASWLVPFRMESYCSDPVWDMDQAHDIANHLVTAFLLSTLKGDTEAAAALAPDTVSLPGIEYQAEGF